MGIDIQVVGAILMIVGVVGLALGLLAWSASGRTATPGGPPTGVPY